MTIAQTVTIPARPAAGTAKPAAGKIEGRRIPVISWLLNRRTEQQLKALDEFYGCLKDSPAFEGDSVEIVRALRAEWDRPWDNDADEA